ncbi:arylamine N-acetyltransferase family protein [Paenalcaligenes sp. Me131]|uniref:arylamine N-acetyltransferase family protein n=1 Tax=Paenalcaligenes sp. Me131 TaxID=3392636 RepID=UPI003D29E402
MSSTTLLSRYFDCLGYQGERQPTLALLRTLHALHPQTFPFENLAPYNDLPVSLDLDALENKLLIQRRGGYCFEQNTLFREVLEQLGYDVVPLIARVRWQVPAHVETGLTHMLLGVRIDGGLWLVDVSFGSTTLTAPLALVVDVPQETPHGCFRVTEHTPGCYCVEFQMPRGWRAVYQFTLEPAQRADYDVGNWYTSTNPRSVFKQELIISRTTPDARELLHNATFTKRGSADHKVYRQQFTEAGEWSACLQDRFGLVLTLDEAEQTFARVRAAHKGIEN